MLPPSRLEIVEFVMDAEVGSIIYLHIALYAEKPAKDGQLPSHIPFTQCQDVPFKVSTTDINFIQNKSAKLPPVGISCANVAIIGHDVGTSKVLITYRNEDIHLEDTVTISTYKPLRMIYPAQDEVVLAVATTMLLLFTGGPKPVTGWPSEFKRSVTSAFEDTVVAKDITESMILTIADDNYVAIKVLCRKLGESYISLSVANISPVPNCKNQETVVTTKVICGKPRAINVQPEIKVADAQSCPMDLSAERVVAQSYKEIELDVSVLDENGRKFLNISSLKLDWKMSPAELGVIRNKDGVYSRYFTINNYLCGNKSYQIIQPKAQTGVIDISATVIGYRKTSLNVYKIKPEWPEFISEDEKGQELAPITTLISLVLVDDTIVTPDVIYVYNHPANRKRLSVKQGSGFYEISLSSSDIADVKYLEGSREIEIKPIRDGELHADLIDLCLTSRPAPLQINVVSIHIIRLIMTDKVEYKKCISCIVRLYDENDNLLDIPDVNMIELRTKLESDIVSIRKVEEIRNQLPGEIHYVITGKIAFINISVFS